MGATNGIQTIGDYSGNGEEDIAELLRLIPDPDADHGTGAVAGGQAGQGGGALDEMSPGAAAQLRVELAALALGGGATAFGSHDATAGEATANEVTIDTGLTTDAALSSLVVSIERGGASVKADAIVTDNGDGTFTITEDTTYDVTAGDTITWAAQE